MSCPEPDEDGECSHAISGYAPGPCLPCLHMAGVLREMSLTDVPGYWWCDSCVGGDQ